MERCEVLVAGGGPVGMVCAMALARAGIDVRLVEAEPELPRDLRASTFHPPTLAMLDALDLLPSLLADGLQAPVIQYRIATTGESFRFDFGELAGECAHPFRLQCEQWKLARLAAERLGGRVALGSAVTGFAARDDGVSVMLGSGETLRSSFLVAADGANSLIRRQLGVPFEGFTWPERFLTFSTDADLAGRIPALDSVNYIADAAAWHVLLRVPGLWRILVPADDRPDAELLADAHVASVMQAIAGTDLPTRHRTLYRVHQRVAARFDHGRVLLAGDAAHLNNPIGGFGMNSGIHDAVALAQALVAILRHGADGPATLARWGRQRRHAARSFIQAESIRNKRLLEGGNEALFDEWRRTAADPAARRARLLRMAMLESLEEAAAVA
jgi:3-(3-hydroxy-phenyl)propionate hydroxylase